jgi:hypothetical protein
MRLIGHILLHQLKSIFQLAISRAQLVNLMMKFFGIGKYQTVALSWSQNTYYDVHQLGFRAGEFGRPSGQIEPQPRDIHFSQGTWDKDIVRMGDSKQGQDSAHILGAVRGDECFTFRSHRNLSRLHSAQAVGLEQPAMYLLVT